MNKLFVIHYYPIDYFPPVMNLIDSLGEKVEIRVSTLQKSNSLDAYGNKKAKIYRRFKENKKRSSLFVLVQYIFFSLFTLYQLIRQKPDAVLYYESISAFPAYLYKRFVSHKVKLCIHYHEYMTPAEYCRPGMRLSKLNHSLETSYLYHVATWVSQTNQYRREFFMNVEPQLSECVCHILPNYPPASWFRKRKLHANEIVKCVYVGSLSLTDTYVLEFCQWIAKQHGKVLFDIYSFNFHKNTLDAIEKLQCPYIEFHKEGIKYSEIPDLFDRYDVGVLLYKAKTMNFKYNETNKFYEYLISGLDVWYPKEMTLLHEMDKSVFAPQIVEMDITQGLFPNVELSPREVDNSSYDRFSEGVYESFMQFLDMQQG